MLDNNFARQDFFCYLYLVIFIARAVKLNTNKTFGFSLATLHKFFDHSWFEVMDL